MDNLANPRLTFLRAQIGRQLSNSPSPLGRWLHGTVKEAEEGLLVMDFTVRADMTNPAGVLHGGAASAILDDLIGTMVYALGREHVYTSVNLTVDFLHAARLGETVTATAKVVRAGKNIIHCEGTITAVDNKIIAKGSTNLVQTSMKSNV